jgi:hypothetical protein
LIHLKGLIKRSLSFLNFKFNRGLNVHIMS